MTGTRNGANGLSHNDVESFSAGDGKASFRGAARSTEMASELQDQSPDLQSPEQNSVEKAPPAADLEVAPSGGEIFAASHVSSGFSFDLNSPSLSLSNVARAAG